MLPGKVELSTVGDEGVAGTVNVEIRAGLAVSRSGTTATTAGKFLMLLSV